MNSKVKKLLALVMTTCMLASAATIIPAVESSAAINWNTNPIPTIKDTTLKKAYKKMGKTMYLLESGQKVRIAITGQSISDTYGNPWCQDLIDSLKAEYPDADIEYQNFGIGGFATSSLKKRLYNDMASFGPDLCIVYDKGSHLEYEEMVKAIRDNMETEILIQTDHYTGDNDWSDTMATTHLPAIATKYNCGLANIRYVWKSYINDNFGGDATVLLKDGSHLNTNGQEFMLGLMKQFFVYKPSNAEEVIADHTVNVSAADWENGVLEVRGTGTRAEVITGVGTQYECDVLVDDKKPSEYADCYIRSAEAGGMTGTIMGIIDYNTPPGEQKWTITIDSYQNATNFTYSVTGATSGSQGSSNSEGVLNGSILNMTPNSFIFDFTKPSVNTTYTFSSILNGTDVYGGDKGYAPNKQLLFNFKSSGTNEHTVKLTAKNASEIPNIKAIRFYDPAMVITMDGDALPTSAPTSSVAPTQTPAPSQGASATQTPEATPSATSAATAATVATATPTPGAATTPSPALPTASSVVTDSPAPTKKATKVSLKFKKKTASVKAKKKIVLKVTLNGAKRAQFTLSNKKVAKIVKKAAKAVTVRGLKKGKTLVKAKAGKKTATCKLTVKK